MVIGDNDMKKKLYIFLTLCLALMICAPMTEAQSKKKQLKDFTVYGNVKSEKGVPLMGVEVNVQDSFIDAMTDENGDFSITIPTVGSVLVFYTEYYKETYQTVTSDGYLQIVMAEAPMGQGAKDKVNMPYWTTQKRDVTASFSTVGGDVLAKTKVMSLGNALMGRVMGMTSRALGGAPGFDESQYLIRFNRTLNQRDCSNSITKYAETEPLIIVDGFERDFAELDPNEIESFSILKDAAGTAIYGDRAANGVILVNTKRGETNKRVINFNYYEGIQNPIYLPDLVDAATFAEWFNEARINDGYAPRYSEEDIAIFKKGNANKTPIEQITHPDINWYDFMFRKTSPQRRASLSMSGGNQIARYFVLFGYSYQGSLWNAGTRVAENQNPDYAPTHGMTKYNLRSNLDVNLTKWLTFSATFANRIQDMIYPSDLTSTVLSPLCNSAVAYPAYFYGIDPELNQEVFMLGGNSTYQNNSFGHANYGGYTQDTYRYYQMSGRFKADFSQFGLKGLYAQIDGHMDGYNYYEVSKTQTFRVWQYTLNPDGTASYESFKTPTSLSTATAYNIQRYNGLEGKIGYQNKWGDHKMHVMGIYTQQRTELKQNNQSDFRYQNFAFYGNYSLKNRYFMDVTLSYAGCDRFYFTNARRTLFPSVGLGWIISDEPWMQSASSWLNFLKMRASWGISGSNDYTFEDINGNDERYPSRERYWSHSTSQQKFGTAETGTSTITEGRGKNPYIKIEKGSMANWAIEGSMFNHQLSFSTDLWFEHRYDIYTASASTAPKVFGVVDGRMPIYNDGIVNSWGTDIELIWAQKFGDFSYSVDAQFSISDNKIVAMGEAPQEFENLVQTGDRVRYNYGLICEGIFKDQAEVDAHAKQMFGKYGPGNLKYKDINEDGYVDANDYTAIGQGRDPRAIGNLCLNLEYKGVGLEVLFQGTGLMTSRLYPDIFHALYDATAGHDGNFQYYMANRFHYDENGNSNWATADFPIFSSEQNANDEAVSDFWEANATYVRLKNIALSYTIPDKFLKTSAVDKARFYISCFNTFTWAPDANKYNFDPEDWLAAIERYPRYRTFNIGVDLTF